MTGAADEVDLTMEELREVARYAAESAQEVLPLFELTEPEDARPRAAVEAAWTFASGAPRSRLQRTSALDAHRAASEARTDAAREAARAAGAAAAAAYLHPLARSTQVRHILGAAAHAARAEELVAGDPRVGDRHIERARRRATTQLVTVLRRYPEAPSGGNRVSLLLSALDASLRTP